MFLRRISLQRWLSPGHSRLVHSSMMTQRVSSSVDDAEVAKFEAQARRWWDPNGHAAPLHRMNPVRVAVIRAAIEKRMSELGVPAISSSTNDASSNKQRFPLSDVSIVDIGCGGGLVTEPLARLGAKVLGVDMSREGVEVARSHMLLDPILVQSHNLSYDVASADCLVAEKLFFDTVLALEIIEHVKDPATFLRDCASLVKPGGLLVVSTLNRTAISYLLGIVAAEKILQWLPEGTHDWTRFLTPEEVIAGLESESRMVCEDVVGISFDPLRSSFYVSSNTSINYMLIASKPLNPANDSPA